MSDDFKLEATLRDDMGKGASRRLRRLEGNIPAIVYGSNKKPVNITLIHKDLKKHLENEAFYSHIISLDIAGKEEDVILKDLQRHPAKDIVLHADFLRVSKTKKLHMQANNERYFGWTIILDHKKWLKGNSDASLLLSF